MKYIPEDFKNQLSGKIDKHEAVKDIKWRLADHDLRCRVTRRKTAKGYKIYLTIYANLPSFHALTSKWTKVAKSRYIVHRWFPNAYISSAKLSSWTYAEYL